MSKRPEYPAWIRAADARPGDLVAVKVQTIQTARREGSLIMLYGTDSMHDYYEPDRDVLLLSRPTPTKE